MTGVARIVVNGSPSAFSTRTGAPGAADANGAFSASETNEYVCALEEARIPARRSRARSATSAAARGRARRVRRAAASRAAGRSPRSG